MKKVLILFIFVLFLCSIFACTNNNQKLDSPVLIVSDNIVSWNNVTDASSYDIYLDGKYFVNTANNYYIFDLENGTYEVSIIARSGKRESAMSEKVSFVKKDASINDRLEKYELLDNWSWEYENMLDEAIEHVSNYHLKTDYWYDDLEYTFTDHTDSDGGYRAEFWGKTIRGGVFTYQYNHDEEVYTRLEKSVKNMLEIQKGEFEGRLSGFSVETEFTGWDLRAHVYTYYGFYYFYQICKDESLKLQIVDSLKQQVDYVIKRIGPGEDQIDILTTSPDWGATTSCNILDGIIKAYLLVKDEKYLTFAKYIIDTGLSSMKSEDGKTLVESALACDPLYKWGCRKLYEDNVCFEGVLDMYLVTGDEYYLTLAMGFYKANAGIETTEIGSLAVSVEEACHSTIEQSNPYNLGRMNEACVQTTWYRYLLKLFLITGNPEMMDYLEIGYYNYGFGNIDWEVHNEFATFSYSPLATMARADIYSGTAFIGEEQTHCQSCCVLSSISLMPVIVKAICLKSNNGLAVNLYVDGKVNTKTPTGKEISLLCETNYPSDGYIKNTISLTEDEEMTLSFRIPSYSKTTIVKVNGEVLENVQAGTYLEINRLWKNNDIIELEFDMSAYLVYASEECSEIDARYNVVVKRGPLVFARDSRIEGDHIYQPLSFYVNENNNLEVKVVESTLEHVQCQLEIKLTDGSYVTLIDYGAAGKTMDSNSVMCLWIPTFDYYSIDLSSVLVLKNDASNSPIKEGFSDKHFVEAKAYASSTDDDILYNFAVTLEKDEITNLYRIKVISSGGYLTIRSDYRLISSNKQNNNSQLFNIVQCGMNRFKLYTKDGLVLSLHDDGTVYITEDIDHPRQYWKFIEIEYEI